MIRLSSVPLRGAFLCLDERDWNDASSFECLFS